MSADGSWLSEEISFGVSSSSEIDRGWWDRGKVDEEQADVSSRLSIRAISPVATSMGDPGNRTLKGDGRILLDFLRK